MGIYIFNKSVLNLFEPGQYIDFPTVVNWLIQAKRNVKVYLSENIWLDIGRPGDYERASEIFEEKRDKFLPPEPVEVPEVVKS